MDTMFSVGSLFAAYSSLIAIVSLFRQFYNHSIPEPARNYIDSKMRQWFTKPSLEESFTLVVNQFENDIRGFNTLYLACEMYISDKLSSTASCLRGNYLNSDEPLLYRIAQGEEYVDTLEKDGIELVWKSISRNVKGEEDFSGQSKCFELCFDVAYKNEVLDGYIPLVVIKYYEDTMKVKKDIDLFTLEGRTSEWKSVKFKHPFTFDALALDPELKQGIISDLDKFIKRKEFYNQVGRAWKRGYLLYGPPGTGKSSLVAAMANYLRFDIYDLQLGSVNDDATLRRLMLSTKNNSIVVIEDVDCSMELYRNYNGKNDRIYLPDDHEPNSKELSLSGMLNFIDGLWSSCGDGRIVVFTSNKKEVLDPALLRPGRMDMHIHLSYLTMSGFKILADNYLGVTGEYGLFNEIEQLLEPAQATPAEVAEELIRSEDADAALSNVVEMLKKRLTESLEKKEGDAKIV